ncbi:1-acyl-sn-glycerol-3-phosphate acyltransferase [Alcanivorax sp. 1008]|uniref:lysophospholipid acyltransferase family protein n=1 Tax=Alcanivorax sp. 1008 TaxID=2816853 RepID=UPI001DEA2E9C|nr:lysophospholipid acyltransferase family protein [Alcanivorax sp. 1008]MCC1495419.1 1-acyl-sn-glycerol-3-phosphate acyltransferase [Alcanivorax sp. 1008]
MVALVAPQAFAIWPELRRLWRLLRIVLHIFYGLLLATVIGAFWRPYRPLVQRATSHWLRCLLDILAVRMEVNGVPQQGTAFLVSNHVSWLDIPLIGVQRSVHFLSKAEVRDWPLIGLLARAVGTLFIRRGSGESQSKSVEIAQHLKLGRTILVFPEGTTTDGRSVKRFFSQLFAAPTLADVPIQPLALRYLDSNGQLDPALAFVGDDEFHLHLWQMLRRDQVVVRLSWGEPMAANGDRDQLARQAHGAVLAMLGS